MYSAEHAQASRALDKYSTTVSGLISTVRHLVSEDLQPYELLATTAIDLVNGTCVLYGVLYVVLVLSSPLSSTKEYQ